MLSKQEASEMPSISYYAKSASSGNTATNYAPSVRRILQEADLGDVAYNMNTLSGLQSVSDVYQSLGLYTPSVTTGGTSFIPKVMTDTVAKLSASSITPTVIQTPTQEKREEKIVARLIRYTVTDATPVLAEKSPEDSILMSGTLMLNGQDDRGFVMELAPKLAEKLAGHNKRREEIEYEDKEGKTRNLKPIKLSQLDVVIEVLREYKS